MDNKANASIAKRRLSYASISSATIVLLVIAAVVWWRPTGLTSAPRPVAPVDTLRPRVFIDTSGLSFLTKVAETYEPKAELSTVADSWNGAADRAIAQIDARLARSDLLQREKVDLMWTKATCFLSLGQAKKADQLFEQTRSDIEVAGAGLMEEFLASTMYFQGVASFRQGENDNCIMCRGESSCIFPISAAAVHKNTDGSRRAIAHYTEYLQHFPDDITVRWLLNLAHMTLGEYPDQVNPRYRLQLDPFLKSEFDIGKFRDIGHIVGVNRFNQAGGAIMEDFDNDGLLDLAVSSFSQTQQLGVYRNAGDGTFEDHSAKAGVDQQFGGLSCVQTDYNNDGLMDIYIPRGAWLNKPIRPSLLKNEGNLKFTDVTEDVGLCDPVNSNAGLWADYDNDGWLDLFVACETQPCRLYRNLGNGHFEETTLKAGVSLGPQFFAKGCTWFDFDNDDFPDLYVNSLQGIGTLFHNNRNGTFSDVTVRRGIRPPDYGFSCWAWDYDNDGWLDLFATCYLRSTADAIRGMTGESYNGESNKLYRNVGGTRFEDVTEEAGLNKIFLTMGSNYGDFDNDGYLDMYLATGEPNLGTLIPNRMFKNVQGKRFSEITASAGVGHLQKGHAVACGDWDRDGNIDIFAQTGGAVDGDRYHNVLFQNPGHSNDWLTVKLVGKRTNRAALGARIKVVTAGDSPLTVYRHVTPGSSFGSSPLQQTIGLGNAKRIAELEIHWPTSGTTQTFRDLDVNQAIQITEFSESFEKLDYPKVTSSK